jgi:hypothetical protein
MSDKLTEERSGASSIDYGALHESTLKERAMDTANEGMLKLAYDAGQMDALKATAAQLKEASETIVDPDDAWEPANAEQGMRDWADGQLDKNLARELEEMARDYDTKASDWSRPGDERQYQGLPFSGQEKKYHALAAAARRRAAQLDPQENPSE